MDPNISAVLVFDGEELRVPARMGEAAPGQLEGTNLEQLVELAGRVCYDSLGRGRDSRAYHAHIQEVGHLSVLEHAVFTLAIRDTDNPPNPLFFHRLLPALVNRPGVWVETHRPQGDKSLRITLNLRNVLEWDAWVPHVETIYVFYKWLGWAVRVAGHAVAPMIVPHPGASPLPDAPFQWNLVTRAAHEDQFVNEEERWATLFLSGSRGMSHEQVRHGDFTAISQRSTRYVDESKAPWVEHPLITQHRAFLESERATRRLGQHQSYQRPQAMVDLRDLAALSYDEAVLHLQTWLEDRGVDKHTARKQARGAARGFLGNALYTELIFSASVAQWKRMLRLRLHAAADAEIRVLYALVLRELKTSRHDVCFDGWETEPAGDGIGEVLVVRS